MEKLEGKIQDVIIQKDEKLKDINRFDSIINEYKKMVDAGLTSHRGYNLMTISDSHIVKYEINR